MPGYMIDSWINPCVALICTYIFHYYYCKYRVHCGQWWAHRVCHQFWRVVYWCIAKTIQLFFIHWAETNQYTLHVTLSVRTLQMVSQPLKDLGSHIVPPGVPFELPYPICRWLLELGQYCTYYQNITILWYQFQIPRANSHSEHTDPKATTTED